MIAVCLVDFMQLKPVKEQKAGLQPGNKDFFFLRVCGQKKPNLDLMMTLH